MAAAAMLAVGAATGCTDGAVTGPDGYGPGDASTAIVPSGYTAVAGDDWSRYATTADLRAANLFWWFRSEDVNQEVDMVADPVFGKVARIRFRQSTDAAWAPSMDAALPQPLGRAWFRWRVKYAPGFTTVGPNPSGYANSYKLAFWLWDGYQGRGQVEFSNTNEYILGFSASQNGSWLQYAEKQLPGSQSFGKVTTEWTDGEWWEYVAYYEKTGATSARQHWWKRRLTNGGAVANNAWTYVGIELSGATTPLVRSVRLGANKNKNNPSTMYIHWGPWEVVDGAKHANPWGMPWQSGQPSGGGGTATQPPTATPTLTRVVVGPSTASVETGKAAQFSATGQYSDGTTKALAVGWSATGGTVSTSGLYTAGQTAGTFRVIGRDGATGLADTSTVTLTAPVSTSAYATLLGDDWTGYTSTSQLSHYYASADLSRLTLVKDPVFGRVLRLTHAAGSTASPRLTRSLPAPANRVWYRWRVRYSSGWSTGGGTWTLGRLGWSGFHGSGQVGFMDRTHQPGFSVRDPQTWAYQRYAETRLTSSTGLGGDQGSLTDGQWYEYVMLWSKTGSTTGSMHWWMRRLTTGMKVAPGPWRQYAISVSGATTPAVASVGLGPDALSRAPSATQYAFWGPWEVVDGTRYANPFAMPGF